MRLKPFYFVLAFITLLSSCRSPKAPIATDIDMEASAKDLIEKHYDGQLEFKNLASRVHVQYEEANKSQSITVSLRMQKDETIWISASILGITLAKLLITPDRVSYYETIGKTYFDGDYALLSSWLGTEINFEIAQNLLLGQAVYDLRKAKYKASVVGANYRLTPLRQDEAFQFLFLMNPLNFKMASQQIIQPSEQRVLTVDYTAYQPVAGRVFPKEIKINVSEISQQTRITLDYRTVDINPGVGFPFRIPDGYDEITIE